MTSRYRIRVTSYLRSDLLRSLRLCFLLAMSLAMIFALNQVSDIAGIRGVSVVTPAFIALAALRLIEHLRGRPMPIWCDVIDALILCGVVVACGSVDAIVGVLFQMVFFRALLSTSGRLILTIGGCWAAAIVSFFISSHPGDIGAFGSLLIVGFLVCGLRSLLLRMQQRERSYQRRLEAAFSGLPLAVVVMDADGGVVHFNNAAAELTQHDGGDLLDLELHTMDNMRLSLGSVVPIAPYVTEAVLTQPDGTIRRLMIQAVSGPDGVIVALQDITAQRLYEEHLRAAALHDSLTGLANRALFDSRAAEYVSEGTAYTAAMLDLDGFKQINDTHGHQVGDELLQAVAQRLRAAAGPEATVARLGGDEFAVLCAGKPEDLEQRYAAIFTEPFRLSCGVIAGGGSVGIASSDAGGTHAELLARADAAMYQSKHLRRLALR